MMMDRELSPVICKNCAALLARRCYERHWWFRLVREPLLLGMRILAWWNRINARTHGVRHAECHGCVRFMRAELDEKSPTFRFLYRIVGERFSRLRTSLLTLQELDEARRHAQEMMTSPEGEKKTAAGPPPSGTLPGKRNPYTKSASLSVLIHIVILCLATLVTGRMAEAPPAPIPPIEVEIEPSRLIDMGSGKLHLTSGSPPPGPKSRPRVRMASAKPAPTKAEPDPSPLRTTETLPAALPGEATPTSVALPLPGDKETEGSGFGYGTGTSSGGTNGEGGGGVGGEGGGEGGGYLGAGYRGGAPPAYPRAARKSGREGVVTIRVLVGTDGTPVSVTVRDTSGYKDFDNVAVQAVKKWIFSPARRRAVPVASFHDVRIRFRLDEAR